MGTSAVLLDDLSPEHRALALERGLVLPTDEGSE